MKEQGWGINSLSNPLLASIARYAFSNAAGEVNKQRFNEAGPLIIYSVVGHKPN